MINPDKDALIRELVKALQSCQPATLGFEAVLWYDTDLVKAALEKAKAAGYGS